MSEIVYYEPQVIEEVVNFSQAAGDLADASAKLKGTLMTDEALSNAIFNLANRVTTLLGGTPTPLHS